MRPTLCAALGAGAIIAAWSGTPPTRGADQVITRHFTPRDQQTTRYAAVPFTVAPGTTHVSVAYTYDKAGGANTIDLGLYEPGPLTLGAKAFRGWSGGSQQTVSVAADEASPGYWPGAIPAGEWHAMLGLYKVGPSGVEVEVRVTTTSGDAKASPALPARDPTPLRRGQAWYVGAMHTHTTHSDGALSPTALVDKARGEKLDFVAITDHNNTTHQLAIADRRDVLVITGEEVTTPGGHFNVWGLGGLRDYIDFRILPGDPAISTVMQQARQRGALVSINHPVSDCLACTWTHDIPDAVTAFEIANGLPANRQQSMAMWDTLLRAGRRITAVGESDWHRGVTPIGMPALRVWAPELTARAILDAVQHGRAIVMANASLPPPEVLVTSGSASARTGEVLAIKRGDAVRVAVSLDPAAYKGARVDLVWSGEVVASAPVDDRGSLIFDRFPAAAGYARVHVSGANGTLDAVANPVFVTIR